MSYVDAFMDFLDNPSESGQDDGFGWPDFWDLEEDLGEISFDSQPDPRFDPLDVFVQGNSYISPEMWVSFLMMKKEYRAELINVFVDNGDVYEIEKFVEAFADIQKHLGGKNAALSATIRLHQEFQAQAQIETPIEGFKEPVYKLAAEVIKPDSLQASMSNAQTIERLRSILQRADESNLLADADGYRLYLEKFFDKFLQRREDRLELVTLINEKEILERRAAAVGGTISAVRKRVAENTEALNNAHARMFPGLDDL